MTIDKSWTKLRNRISPEFLNGLNNFEAMCKEKFGENAQVFCPCERHHNNGVYSIKQVISDIHKFGWSSTYETWKYHGEQALPRNYDEDTDDDADDIPGEMFEALHDVWFENTTNEHDANVGTSTSSSSSIHDDLDALNMEAKNQAMRDEYNRRRKKRLYVGFDDTHTKTWRAVGENSTWFTHHLGSVVDKIPYHYGSWDEVPEEDKNAIFPEIEEFFDLRPHFRRHGPLMHEAIKYLAQEIYRRRKSTFKKKAWTQRGGEENLAFIRANVPEGYKKENWPKFVEAMLNEKHLKSSQTNVENRRKQQYASRHGGKSNAQYLYDSRNPQTGAIPSLIDHFGQMHRRPDGSYTGPLAQQQHDELVRLREERIQLGHVVDEEAIMREVLGERSGHRRGIGPYTKRFDKSSSSQGSQPEVYYSGQQVHQYLNNFSQEWVANINDTFTSLVTQLQQNNIQMPDYILMQAPVPPRFDPNYFPEENEENDDDC